MKRRRKKGGPEQNREELARGRRERGRQARADLAAKAKGEESGDGAEKNETKARGGGAKAAGDKAAKPAKAKSEKTAKAEARAAQPKAGKPAKRGAAQRKREERQAARERLLGRKQGEGPDAGRQGDERSAKPDGAKDERRGARAAKTGDAPKARAARSELARAKRDDAPRKADQQRDLPGAAGEGEPQEGDDRRETGKPRAGAAKKGVDAGGRSERRARRGERRSERDERAKRPGKRKDEGKEDRSERDERAKRPGKGKGEGKGDERAKRPGKGKDEHPERARTRLRDDRDETSKARRRRPAKPSRRRRAGAAKRAAAGVRRGGRGAAVALKRGVGETRTRVRRTAPKAGNAALNLLASAFALLFAGFGLIARVLVVTYRRVAPPVRAGLRLAQRAINAVSRQVTPVRVLAFVVAGAALLLALSQFAEYRSVSIGNDAYAEGLQTVAPAPVRETADTGSAHSYLMVPLAAVALVLLGAALTGRWRLCRLIALAGVIAIAVGLLHDRPAGLDPGADAVAYTGVEATLLGGFYAQLFSGLLLTLSSLLLGRELRLAGARRTARDSRVAHALRRPFRRGPRAEGVSA